MRGRFQNFMSGRYGNDQLNNFLSIVALIIIVVDIFLRINILWLVAVVLLVLIYIRMLSRNTGKREAENDKFLNITSRFRRGGGGYSYGGGGYQSYDRKAEAAKRRAHREDMKYYRFFDCPNCGQKVRVPKGKGKIEITCPKCRTNFIRRS
ncbi:MAG: hypothetical protein LUC41_07760 [Clostridiales bacterium]|nr:hypothetical protein [Clostridiales bacterium]